MESDREEKEAAALADVNRLARFYLIKIIRPVSIFKDKSQNLQIQESCGIILIKILFDVCP